MTYWGDFAFLLAVERSGSFNRAASDLGVTHSTVARRIRQLEARLGSKLLEPSKEGLNLTPAGRLVLTAAETVEETVHELETVVSGQDASLVGSLRVTTSDLVAHHLSPVLVGFFRDYPDIFVQLLVDNQPRSLFRREAEVAVRATNDPPEGLVGRRLGRWNYAPYVRHNQGEDREAPVDFTDYPWVGYAASTGARIHRAWLADRPELSTIAEVDSGTLMLQAVLDGVGASFLPCDIAEGSPLLRRIGAPDPAFSTDIWAFTPEELRGNARVRAFFAHIAPAFRGR